jgi:hypothetical protein
LTVTLRKSRKPAGDELPISKIATCGLGKVKKVTWFCLSGESDLRAPLLAPPRQFLRCMVYPGL